MEENVVLDDAAAQNQFSGDNYLIRERPRSLLCFPLAAQRVLTGALYLENALAPRAFAPERLDALELLASQAAVSLLTGALGIDLTHEIKEQKKQRLSSSGFIACMGRLI
jgi:GAF domain-containing protein